MDSYYRDDLNLRKVMKEQFNYEFKYPPIDPKVDGVIVSKLSAEEDPDGVETIYSYRMEGPRSYWNTHCVHEMQSGHIITERAEHNFNMFIEIRNYKEKNPGFYDELVKIHEATKAIPADQTETPWTEFQKNFDYTKLSKAALNEMYWEIDQNAHNNLQANVAIYSDMKAKNLIIINKFVGAPTKTMVDKNAYLTKLQGEYFAKIIMGNEPVDAFDKFVEEWKKAGGDQITKEVNEWYAGIK
jgi:hypothetical protein